MIESSRGHDLKRKSFRLGKWFNELTVSQLTTRGLRRGDSNGTNKNIKEERVMVYEQEDGTCLSCTRSIQATQDSRIHRTQRARSLCGGARRVSA